MAPTPARVHVGPGVDGRTWFGGVPSPSRIVTVVVSGLPVRTEEGSVPSVTVSASSSSSASSLVDTVPLPMVDPASIGDAWQSSVVAGARPGPVGSVSRTVTALDSTAVSRAVTITDSSPSR